MADVNNGEQPTIPTKRCSDISSQDASPTPKKQKLNTNNNTPTLEQQEVPLEEQNKQTPHEKIEESEQLCNQKLTIDRKGKGILIEEEEEDDDDDDDSGSGSDENLSEDEEGEDGDFVDDPLAEVDLDNILPCRTRRRSIQPGAYIATDLPDDDDSDDPDA